MGEEGKGSLPGSNVHEVDKGPRLAEAAGGQTQDQEGHGDAQAEADPGQEHGEQAGEEHPWREADGEAGRLPAVPPPTPPPGPPASSPTEVKSRLTTRSERTFLERRKSASRPPRMMLIKATPSSRADRKPL